MYSVLQNGSRDCHSTHDSPLNLDADADTMYRYLLNAPKWGQGSEVSRESNDNRDNYYANHCIMYVTHVVCNSLE